MTITKFKSEIRPSQIRDLLEKAKQNKHKQYLKAVKLIKIRSFSGDRVQFDSPVTALIGPNGGGKSTILGAAACAYKVIKPGTFFPKSSIGDNSMADWTIEYELVDKGASPTKTIIRSARFKNLKWKRDDVSSREVKYFGINRTVPAGEKTYFKRLTKRSYKPKGAIINLSPAAANQAEKILGKSLKAFKVAQLDPEREFYVGGNGKIEYSEFHFGAGEASIIRMVSEIEKLAASSLVLIEEIENGLHPVAVRRMVEYLLDVAERKNIQAIFTTHSDAALEPLPPEAIWASIDGNVQQGKLSVEALRAISGRVDRKLAIFVEDQFAKDWLEAIIREHLTDQLDEIGVYAVGGDSKAIAIHIGHTENPAIDFKSLCFLDGDSPQAADEPKRVFKLPGAAPESYIFNSAIATLDKDIVVLTVACQRPPERQADVKKAIERVSTTNRDHHLLFNQVGVELGLVPEEIIKGAFFLNWIRNSTMEVEKIVSSIKLTFNPPEDD